MEESVRQYLSTIGRKGAKSQARTLGDKLHEVRSAMGKKGGKARAAKFSKAQLKAWAKLGGRPPKKQERPSPFPSKKAEGTRLTQRRRK
jgi:hypothetical protein